jgi:23S rRNA pseudouridine2457 synthase
MLVLFNKPYGVLSQFTSNGGRWKTLAEFVDVPNVYAAGRLDADSEGLLLLTDNGALQAAVAGSDSTLRQAHGSTDSPRAAAVTKTYWAHVEGIANDEHAAQLMRGVQLNDGPARAVDCKALGNMTEPWPRDPPIRVRKSVPDSWIELTLDEGRNRQVRRMTAAVGLPTLRLIRVAIGPWRVDDLPLGTCRVIDDDEAFRALRDANQSESFVQ